jgi:LmbE family N-acetylglucosaminyl deacetylase/glycosyltransferase involved in cell wall biosynthesis
MTEEDHIPYVAQTCFEASSVIVLAPHADDEVFGCGGSLALHAQLGVPIRVVIATAGGARGDDGGARLLESQAAAVCLGIPAPECWGLPDRGLYYGEELIARIEHLIHESGADLVYAPSPFEIHPDHFALAQAAIVAVCRIGGKVRLVQYEVGVPLRPSHLLDISPVWNLKSAAMRCFASQLVHQRYDEHISSLNHFRTYTLPPSILAAEAFVLTDGGALARGEWPTADSQNNSKARFALVTALAAKPPLVSVLIRSSSRSYLAETLASVANQTYSRIEVVIVNAHGKGHMELPELCDSFPLRFVEAANGQPLPRSQAANLALDSARGEFLLFLDDDDWLASNHVARLVEQLEGKKHFVAAYSDTQCIPQDPGKTSFVFSADFDSGRLLAENFLPIHSVLFSCSVLKSPSCRFDEQLDLYEDWDFWINVAMQGDFLHVPGVSAFYRIHESSGVHTQNENKESQRNLVWRKWKNGISDEQREKLIKSYLKLHRKMEEARRQLDEKVDEAKELSARNQYLLVSLDELKGRNVEQLHRIEDLIRNSNSEFIKQVTELANKINEAKDINLKLLSENSILASIANDSQHENKLLASRCADLADVVNALHRSTSWRITAPLRWLITLLRRD